MREAWTLVRRVGRLLASGILLLWPLLALLLQDRIFDEPYPEIDFGALVCPPATEATDLHLVFDDSGSMGWNDPYDRRYQEARQITGWWSREGCNVGDRTSISHFDNALGPLPPTSTDDPAVDTQLVAASSSSQIAPSAEQVMAWAGATRNRGIVLFFSDGENPDILAARDRLSVDPSVEVVFVALGQELPVAWNDPVVDAVISVGKRPSLGAVGMGVAETIMEVVES